MGEKTLGKTPGADTLDVGRGNEAHNRRVREYLQQQGTLAS